MREMEQRISLIWCRRAGRPHRVPHAGGVDVCYSAVMTTMPAGVRGVVEAMAKGFSNG